MPLVDARLTPLSSLVSGLDLLLSQDIADDAVYCAVVAKRLQRALQGRWLPPEARRSAPEGYQRHLLHEDPAGRFSIGSFVWQPGQETPVHDHNGWSVVGVIEGQLISENFELDREGRLSRSSLVVLKPGVTTWLAPGADIHRLFNPSTWATAISIHVYGSPFAAACRSRYEISSGGDGRNCAGDAPGAAAPVQPQPVRRI
jgi:predicted metal-dependent enzyme (double-stranded beta helix superfamily)